jgi:rSAM/selenodomain-associated transferase 2
VTRLSIILPVLDEAVSIATRLADLQTLRKQGVELVVVDGGSGDGTVATVCRAGRPGPGRGRGRARQMNTGAGASHGDILLFLHADTALPAQAVAAVAHAIEAGALWGRFDVRIDGRHPMLRIVERMMNWRSRLTGIATGDQAIFLRRDLFERIGGYEDIPLMEDIRLCARLKCLAAPACLSRPGDDVGTTLGKTWRLAHRAADVAPACGPLLRCRSEGPGATLRIPHRALKPGVWRIFTLHRNIGR